LIKVTKVYPKGDFSCAEEISVGIWSHFGSATFLQTAPEISPFEPSDPWHTSCGNPPPEARIIMVIEKQDHIWNGARLSGTPAIWVQPLAIDGIRQTCERVASAWTRGDSGALAAALAPDCDHLMLGRVRQVKRGRDALVALWLDAFARRTPDFSVRMMVNVQSLRPLADDLALVDGLLEYSSGIGANGVSQGRSSQPFTAVMIRSDATWLILSLRVGTAIAAYKVVSLMDDRPHA
jgi:uncharacterized protein (TIGR02246 family)